MEPEAMVLGASQMSFEKGEGHLATKAKMEVNKDEFQLLIEALSQQIYTQCLQKDLM